MKMATLEAKNEEDSETTVETSPAAAPRLAPEEGFQGWLCVVGVFVCIFCTFGFLSA